MAFAALIPLIAAGVGAAQQGLSTYNSAQAGQNAGRFGRNDMEQMILEAKQRRQQQMPGYQDMNTAWGPSNASL